MSPPVEYTAVLTLNMCWHIKGSQENTVLSMGLRELHMDQLLNNSQLFYFLQKRIKINLILMGKCVVFEMLRAQQGRCHIYYLRRAFVHDEMGL